MKHKQCPSYSNFIEGKTGPLVSRSNTVYRHRSTPSPFRLSSQYKNALVIWCGNRGNTGSNPNHKKSSIVTLVTRMWPTRSLRQTKRYVTRNPGGKKKSGFDVTRRRSPIVTVAIRLWLSHSTAIYSVCSWYWLVLLSSTCTICVLPVAVHTGVWHVRDIWGYE